VTLTILHVGKVRNRAIAELIDDYADRIGHDARIERLCVKDARDPQRDGAEILRALEERLGRVIALTEEGKTFDSVQFARKIAGLPPRTVFVIGGPDGLSDAVKRRADELLSLSPMTLPHELAQLVLVEQLYRALSIIRNRRYHRARVHP
jgi:23S rRNA (pseudouridine1915-N3)-methyltransferase